MATTGRPPTPLEDRRTIFQTFVDAVEDGQTIREACDHAGVSWRGIARWIADESNTLPDGVTTFSARYAHARTVSAQAFAEKALETALDAPHTKEGVARARLQVDTYKWRAAMADPKGYGDRQQVEHTHLGTLHLAALQAPRTTATAKLASPNDIAQLASATEDTPYTDSIQDE